MRTITFLLMFVSISLSYSQVKLDTTLKSEIKKDSKWYDKIAIRGYLQARYNRLLETNPDLKCEQCDKWEKMVVYLSVVCV
jgi:hypothetical protein